MLPGDTCRSVNGGRDGWVQVLTCASTDGAENVYAAELLVVAVILLIVGAFFILQSCQVSGTKPTVISLNNDTDRESVCVCACVRVGHVSCQYAFVVL